VLVALAEHLGEQLLLRSEVVQEGRRRHTDDLGDLLERGVLVALASDHVERALEDLLASSDALRI
jgi:hypothetical protein